MTGTYQIRVSEKFKDKMRDLQAICLRKGKKLPSEKKITDLFAKYLDTERIFQNEINKL